MKFSSNSRFHCLVIAVMVAACGTLGWAAGDTPAGEDEAPSEHRRMVATRLLPDETIRIDGQIDEPAWNRAEPAGGFVQRQPREGAAATQPTEVRVLYDTHYLYIGVKLFDDDPAGIVGPPRERDAHLGADDQLTIVLDTFGTGRTGYLFETNPAGVIRDALLTGGRDVIDSWDTVWDVRTRRLPDGWQAEFKIPFQSIAFDRSTNEWVINFRRIVRRTSEQTLWSGYGQAQGIYRTLYAGRISGLEGMSQGRGFEFKPYALARRTELRGEEADNDADAGFDLSYNLTPGLNAALTVNTDFADTEVDLRIVNLSRFPVRLPEKRDFFLEGAAVFDFPGDSRVTPYYSRRIGLVREGPVPVQVGGRLVGQAGISELGVLYLRTEAAHGLSAETFTVARGRFTVAEDTYVGGLLTRREGVEAGDRFTLASDADIRLVDLGDGGKISLIPYGVYTSAAPGDDESGWLDRTMFGAEVDFRSGGSRGDLEFVQVGEAYDPAVGFAFDRGYREYEGSFRYRRQMEDDPRILQIDHRINFGLRTDLDDDMIDAEVELQAYELEWASGDQIFLGGWWEAENFDEDFEIWDGVIVPADRYSGLGFWLGGATAEMRRWSAAGEVFWQQFYGGERIGYVARLGLRPIAGLDVSVTGRFNDIRLPGGDFTTQLIIGRIDHAFTTRHSLNLLAQYDNESNSIGLQVRFRWQPTPGSELFLGYLHDWEQIDDDLGGGTTTWVTAGRQSTIKGSYTWRF